MASGRNRGFTITEVLVVILILAIVAGLLGPSVAATVRLSRMSSGAGEVTTALRRARNLAIVTGEMHAVVPRPALLAPEQSIGDGAFARPRAELLVVRVDDIGRPRPASGGYAGLDVVRSFTLPPDVDFDIQLTPDEVNENRQYKPGSVIIFLPDGGARGEGFGIVHDLVVIASDDYGLEESERIHLWRRIRVNPLTGRFSIERIEPVGWE